MKVGIIGSGGREHAICDALIKSKKIKEIYCFPGNGGTAQLAKNIDIDLNNFDEIKKFVLEKNIDLIVVGPEKPLVEGIVDFFEKNKIKIFVQTKLLLNLKDQKYLQKNCVKNIKFQVQNLVFLKILMKLKNL